MTNLRLSRTASGTFSLFCSPLTMAQVPSILASSLLASWARTGATQKITSADRTSIRGFMGASSREREVTGYYGVNHGNSPQVLERHEAAYYDRRYRWEH